MNLMNFQKLNPMPLKEQFGKKARGVMYTSLQIIYLKGLKKGTHGNLANSPLLHMRGVNFYYEYLRELEAKKGNSFNTCFGDLCQMDSSKKSKNRSLPCLFN
jgi:hypothetical protein